MDTIVKAIMGTFFLLLISLTGVGFLASSVDARNADAFLADCTTRIESSNYASSVIGACEADAAEQDYELQVDTYSTQGSSRTSYGHMTLTYHFRIPMLGIDSERHVYADLH